jgi:malic enzyme
MTERQMSSGQMILRNPHENKGTSFSKEEREKLGLRGLLPPHIESMDFQLERVLAQFRNSKGDLQKWIMLNTLQRRNERLFYRLLIENLVETMPIVYTPTVGKACQEFGNLFRGEQGLYISIFQDKGEIHKVLDNWHQTPDIIVVTDGSRILGLGDLGVNGMGIPVGKLSLYVAGGGFCPSKTLPITLDVGTNTDLYLKDPFYLGNPVKRVRGQEFIAFTDEFMKAVYTKWPKCVVQFEDFSNDVCFELLERYRHQYRCFNDDIQGTGAVVVSGFLNAVKITQVPLLEHKVVFLGAGSASTGVATYIAQYMVQQGATEEQAHKCFYLIDSKGLVTTTRGDTLENHKIPFARSDCQEKKTLLDVIKCIKPTAIIGLSGQGGTFTEDVIREMAKNNKKPIIFPLSNPTSKSECSAEDAYKFTNGTCIFASGSPFDEVVLDGITYKPGQGNNMYIFPGLGLGTVVSQAKQVSDTMIVCAATTLAQY